VIGDLNREAGEALAREIGPATRFVATDVTDESSVMAAVGVAANELGNFAGVVNCAGIITGTRVLGREGPHDLALFTRVVQVNLVGTFNVIRLAAAALQKNEPSADGERGVADLHGVSRGLRRSDWAGGVFSLEGWRGRDDVADRP